MVQGAALSVVIGIERAARPRVVQLRMEAQVAAVRLGDRFDSAPGDRLLGRLNGVPAVAVHVVGDDDAQVAAGHGTEAVFELGTQLTADLVEIGDVAVIDEADRNPRTLTLETRDVLATDLRGGESGHVGRIDDVLRGRDDAEAVTLEADDLHRRVGRSGLGAALGGTVDRGVQQLVLAVELGVDLGRAVELGVDHRLLLEAQAALIEQRVARVRNAARQTRSVGSFCIRPLGRLGRRRHVGSLALLGARHSVVADAGSRAERQAAHQDKRGKSTTGSVGVH